MQPLSSGAREDLQPILSVCRQWEGGIRGEADGFAITDVIVKKCFRYCSSCCAVLVSFPLEKQHFS